MNEKSEVKKKKTATKKKTTNRINYNKGKEKQIEKKRVIEEEKKVKKEESSPTTFNLIEVIIIMIITAVFGILIGSCVVYFKDNVIDNNVPYELEEFMDVYDDISSEFYNDVDRDKLLEAGIKGMVQYLGDPYSSYLDYDETYSLNEELEGEFVGMGATVSLDDSGNIYIYDIMDDSPASKAGFKVGDVIKSVDDKNVVGLSTAEVSYLIKGKEGTKVKIGIMREEKEMTLTLTRGKIELTSVDYFVTENEKVGYIKISIFAKNTPDQLRKAMKALSKEGVESIILDVRDNTGGYLNVAEEIASMFLDKDKIIYQLDTKGKIENIKSVGKKEYDLPVAVLINGNSASASEILAAALNENLDAPLVGQKTFGKGTVQKKKELSSGAMIKYTVQEWYTPKGNRVNKIGLTPTVEVVMDEAYYENPSVPMDNQLTKAIEVLSK